MGCQRISNTSNCCQWGLAIGIASVCTLIVLGVIFRHQIPPIARKFASFYTHGPLKIQLPLVAGSAAIATFILANSIYLCYERRQPKLPLILTVSGYAEQF